MRLAVRTPFAGRALLDFLADHAVPGVEAAGAGWYARTLDLPHGPGTVRLELADRLDRRRRPRFVPADVPARRPARHRAPRSSAPAGCSTPTATRSPSTTPSPATR